MCAYSDNGSCGKNIIGFGVDHSSSVYIDNKNRNILVLGEEPTQGLDNTTITADAKYPFNFIKLEFALRVVLSMHYNFSKSFLFINASKLYRFKAKGSKIKPYSLSLGNISRDFKSCKSSFC